MKPRFVIRNPKGYYTEMRLVKCAPVLIDGTVVGHRSTWRPKFNGMVPAHASQFDTAKDAQQLIDDPKFGRRSFAGCQIESTGA